MTFLSLFSTAKTHPEVLPTFDFDKTRTNILQFRTSFNQKTILLPFPLKIDQRTRVPVTNDFVKDVKDTEN